MDYDTRSRPEERNPSLSEEMLGRAIYAALRKANPKAWIEGDLDEEASDDTVLDEITIDGAFRFGLVARHLIEILCLKHQL